MKIPEKVKGGKKKGPRGRKCCLESEHGPKKKKKPSKWRKKGVQKGKKFRCDEKKRGPHRGGKRKVPWTAVRE